MKTLNNTIKVMTSQTHVGWRSLLCLLFRSGYGGADLKLLKSIRYIQSPVYDDDDNTASCAICSVSGHMRRRQ